MIADDSTTVFISYAREDMYAAERFHRELTSAGLNVWFDKLSLLPGQDWKVSIKQAINGSRYFLAILSRNSVNKKGFVQKELAEALEIIKEFPPSEIFIIPVRLDDCEPSHIKLKDFHWADMFPRWEDGFAKVLSAIRTSSKTTDSRNETISDKNLSEYDLVGRSRELKSEINKCSESSDKISETLSYTAHKPQVAHIETWADFGRNLSEYVRLHREELIAKSYDTIIAISEGGSIIAFSLSCELKATLHEYSKPFKASVIPISVGFAYEGDIDELRIKHLEDIINKLGTDLKNHSTTYNNGGPINVLIIDDNLTGATCINFFKRKLGEMGCVANLGTLAYVRHPAFLKMDTIREYPEKTTCFVMPWAKLHEKRDMGFDNNKIDIIKIKICIKLNKNFDSFNSFVDRLRRIYKIEDNLIINGSSVFYLRYTDLNDLKFLELRYMHNVYYPPKHCLRPNNTHNESNKDDFLDLCSFDIHERTIGICLVCSLLNRNRYLIRRVSTLAYSDEIYIKLRAYDNYDNNIKLRLRIPKNPACIWKVLYTNRYMNSV